jgi:hypothetical protein
MSFSGDLTRFVSKTERRTQDVFTTFVVLAHESIQTGSPITGAPGQPVDTGNLRNSWGIEFETPTQALISSPVEYAPFVEDNVRGVTFRVGGPHSQKLTIAGATPLLEEANRRVGDG